MGPERRIPKANERVETVPIGRFLAPKKHGREAFGYFPNSFSTHFGEYIECDQKDTLIPRRRRDLFADLHIPIPIAVTAVAYLAAFLPPRTAVRGRTPPRPRQPARHGLPPHPL